jgi:hypothetical protein
MGATKKKEQVTPLDPPVGRRAFDRYSYSIEKRLQHLEELAAAKHTGGPMNLAQALERAEATIHSMQMLAKAARQMVHQAHHEGTQDGCRQSVCERLTAIVEGTL